ncbi:protein of unknown function [Streptomyces murinus]
MAHAQKQQSAGAVQSVDRAVSVLEILARDGEAGVTEIATELEVHKSTAFRLLGVLEQHGLVAQAKDRGKYYLGAGVLRLAGAAAVRLDISQEGVPICREVADELGETVNLAVLDEDAAVNIMQARGTASVAAQNWLGGAPRCTPPPAARCCSRICRPPRARACSRGPCPGSPNAPSPTPRRCGPSWTAWWSGATA